MKSLPENKYNAEPIAPAYSSNMVNNWDEGGQQGRAVLRVAVSSTRDELVAALAYQWSMDPFEPGTLSVEQVRFLTEGGAYLLGAIGLRREADDVWRGYHDWPDAEQVIMQGIARAIDRAYPPVSSNIVLDGQPSNATVRCTVAGCGWSRNGGSCNGRDVEWLINEGTVHSETHQPDVSSGPDHGHCGHRGDAYLAEAHAAIAAYLEDEYALAVCSHNDCSKNCGQCTTGPAEWVEEIAKTLKKYIRRTAREIIAEES